MRTPAFWERDGLLPALLTPASLIYEWAARRRRRLAISVHAPVPVICVGNLVAGGAGKTPVALALGEMLSALGETPHFVSRGYGGSAIGPLRVDPLHHGAAIVGDEPLLLAWTAPAWIARDRPAGVRMAAAAGATIVILDDGLQNPTLHQDLSLLVVDGTYGFGNGRLLPAGPLRERPADALPRLGAVIMLGADLQGVALSIGEGTPVLEAVLTPRDPPARWRRRKVVAFAGIGRPEKFFATLEQAGATILARHGFADHHPYSEDELGGLLRQAEITDAALVTTEKDWVRVPDKFRDQVGTLAVELAWKDEPTAARARDLLVTVLGR